MSADPKLDRTAARSLEPTWTAVATGGGIATAVADPRRDGAAASG